jgi:PPOX class probable F420-dependent enzyme
MEEMTPEETRAFLLARPARTGKLATVRADGRPHIAPIWFDLDGDTVLFTTWHESVKAANLEQEGRAALCVDEEAPPFAYVIIEGDVTIDKEPAEGLYWATRIAGRYMGSELADSYGERNAVLGEWLIRLTPSKIIAHKDIAD